MTIKTICTTLAIAAIAVSAQAQQTTEMTVNGLKVILKPSKKQTVSAVMFFKGGTANYTAEREGIENLAISATTECGTAKYNKDMFKDIADKYGIGLGGSSGFDFSYITMSCVKPYFKQGWDLFGAAITTPVFDEKELGMLQQKLITNLKQEEGDPDSKLRKMAMSNTFKGTRYASQPSGTPETLEKFTAKDVTTFYNKTLLNKNRMLLVVVGDITADELKQFVERSFTNLPNAALTTPQLKALDLKIANNNSSIEERELATNYIMGVMGAPSANAPEFNSYQLAINILRERLFEEVRTKRNLSYAPSAFVRSGMQTYAGIYVTTTKPKEAMEVMVDEIKRLRNGGFTEVDLRDSKSAFATGYFMKNESNGAIAMALGAAEIKSSWKNEETFLDQINAVTLPNMQKTFSTYADGIQWNYLGITAQADKAAFERKTK